MRTDAQKNTQQLSQDEVIRQCDLLMRTLSATKIMRQVFNENLAPGINPAEVTMRVNYVMQTLFYLESKLTWSLGIPNLSMDDPSAAGHMAMGEIGSFYALKNKVVDAMKSGMPFEKIAKNSATGLQACARKYYPDFDANKWLRSLFETYQKSTYSTLLSKTLARDCSGTACPTVDELSVKYQELLAYCQVTSKKFGADAAVIVQRERLRALARDVASEYGSLRQDARDFNSFVAKYAGQYNDITGCQGTHAAAQWLCERLKQYRHDSSETAWVRSWSLWPHFENSGGLSSKFFQLSLQVYKAEHPEAVAQQVQAGAGAGAGAGASVPITAVYASQPVQTPELLASKQRLKMARILIDYAENKVRAHWPRSTVTMIGGHSYIRDAKEFDKPRAEWDERMSAVSTILDAATPIDEAMACFYDAMKSTSKLPAALGKRHSALAALQQNEQEPIDQGVNRWLKENYGKDAQKAFAKRIAGAVPSAPPEQLKQAVVEGASEPSAPPEDLKALTEPGNANAVAEAVVSTGLFNGKSTLPAQAVTARKAAEQTVEATGCFTDVAVARAMPDAPQQVPADQADEAVAAAAAAAPRVVAC